MGRRPTACVTCASIKTRCSKQVPCSRCHRLQLPCSLSGARSTSSMDTARGMREIPANRPDRNAKSCDNYRARHSNSSMGCVSCRRRKKKCDETRPVCGDCNRLGLPCMYGNSAECPSQPAPSPTPTADSLESTKDDEAMSDFFDWLAVIDDDYVAEKSINPSTLAHSSALEVLLDARARHGGAMPPSTALSNLASIDPMALEIWTVGERHLLNHFLQFVARSMVMVGDEDNPFLSVIVPMVFENDAVRNALAALSATHLSKVYPDFDRNHLLHRSMALRALKAQLDDPKAIHWALAATLLLCLSEVCEAAIVMVVKADFCHRSATVSPEDGCCIFTVRAPSSPTSAQAGKTHHLISSLTCTTTSAVLGQSHQTKLLVHLASTLVFLLWILEMSTRSLALRLPSTDASLALIDSQCGRQERETLRQSGSKPRQSKWRCRAGILLTMMPKVGQNQGPPPLPSSGP